MKSPYIICIRAFLCFMLVCIFDIRVLGQKISKYRKFEYRIFVIYLNKSAKYLLFIQCFMGKSYSMTLKL